jgi:hypothetical protein
VDKKDEAATGNEAGSTRSASHTNRLPLKAKNVSKNLQISLSRRRRASPNIDYQFDCLVFHVFEIHFKILFDFNSKEF